VGIRTLSTDDYSAELEVAVDAATIAGQIVQGFYEQSEFAVYDKEDGSPVTDADLAADREIRRIIGARFPQDAFLTEETVDDPSRLQVSRCWIVDPIDGTAQFIARTGRFDVVIALVVDGRPVVGAICHPPSATILAGMKGRGAWRIDDTGKAQIVIPPARPDAPLRVAGSIWFGVPSLQHELDRIIEELGAVDAPALPTGIRPLEILDPGRPFDVVVGPIPRIDKTYGGEWDFAAPDLIITEAGGAMSDLFGEKHRFNKPLMRNTGGLIYSCDPATHARVVAACAAGIPTLVE
jgi:3'-phosphoadenosine 5'-phosphosulfate (PAPS) 3'-phosphatase